MSLLDAPLALLDRVIARRSPPVQVDDPVARMVARTSGRLRPNPTYRRRLRGRVMNQYVATREGLALPPMRRQMTRIGRSVLYASVALALSVTAVGAASGSALPGDPLYAVKRQIELVRIDIAPGWVRSTLVAMSLDERLSEIERLAGAGRWSLVPATVADVDAAEALLADLGGSIPPDLSARLAKHSQVLAALQATAPAAAQAGLANALGVSNRAAAATSSGGNGPGATGNGTPGGGNGASASPTPKATPSPPAAPSKSPKPTASPRPTDSPPAAAPSAPAASPRSDSQGPAS